MRRRTKRVTEKLGTGRLQSAAVEPENLPVRNLPVFLLCGFAPWRESRFSFFCHQFFCLAKTKIRKFRTNSSTDFADLHRLGIGSDARSTAFRRVGARLTSRDARRLKPGLRTDPCSAVLIRGNFLFSDGLISPSHGVSVFIRIFDRSKLFFS